MIVWGLPTPARSIYLGWMIKPQLLIALLFFAGTWGWERLRCQNPSSRAASIGRLLAPWAGVLVCVSLFVSFPAALLSYRQFLGVALTWHTRIAESYPNSSALSAILAKAVAREWNIPVLQSLPLLMISIAIPLVVWNSMALATERTDSLRAFFPWLPTSLLWTSLVWEWYFSLVLVAPILMIAMGPCPGGAAGGRLKLRLALALVCTTAFSSFLFTLGLILPYCESHAMQLRKQAPNPPRGCAML